MLGKYQFSAYPIAHFFIIFFRLFPVVWLFPGFGMAAIPANIRLAFTLLLTLVLFSFIPIPIYPEQIPDLGEYFLKEFLIGLFIGGCFAAIFQVLDTTGAIIAQQMGISNTTIFTPILENTVSLPSVLLSASSLAIFFILDIHHYIIKAFFFSYQHADFQLLSSQKIESSWVEYSVHLMNVGFKVALQMAAPFMVANLFLHAALGILNRLVPSIHVFFLSQPLQITLGLAIFLVTISKCLESFTHFFASVIDIFYKG